MEPEFNIRALIASLGGAQKLPSRFRSVGISPPPVSTIVGWRRRNSAPGPWTLAMLYVAATDKDMPNMGELILLMKESA
jgi:hypothetical protein